jgi:ABC transporter transmembrane region
MRASLHRRTADYLDYLLIAIGIIAGLGTGVMLPMFSLVFGDFTNAFGRFWPTSCRGPPPPGLDVMPQSEFHAIIQEIALKFLYLGIGKWLRWMDAQPWQCPWWPAAHLPIESHIIGRTTLCLCAAAAVSGYMQQAAWIYTSVRQANRLRQAYLRGILRCVPPSTHVRS